MPTGVSALDMGSVPTGGRSPLPHPTHNVNTTGRPPCASYLYKRLQLRPTIPPGVLSLSLLKTAFPYGYNVAWPRGFVTMSPTWFVASDGSSSEGRQVDVVLNNNVPLFLQACVQPRITVKALHSHEEVGGFVRGPVGTHTAFVARVIVNPRRSTKDTHILRPLTRLRGSATRLAAVDVHDSSVTAEHDDNYDTHIVICPQTGTFYSDYGYVWTGNLLSLVPMPIFWLGLHNNSSNRTPFYIKRFEHNSIYKVTVYGEISNSSVDTQPNTRVINAVQLHNSHPDTPLIPPDLFDMDIKTNSRMIESGKPIPRKKPSRYYCGVPHVRMPTTNTKQSSINNQTTNQSYKWTQEVLELCSNRPTTQQKSKTGNVEYKPSTLDMNNHTNRRLVYNAKYSESTTKGNHHRRYVRGCRHTKTDLSLANVLDHRLLGDFDLAVKCRSSDNNDTHVSYIRVRQASHQVQDMILKLGQGLCDGKMKGNARVDSGDAGEMFATGSRHQVVSDGVILQYVMSDFNKDKKRRGKKATSGSIGGKHSCGNDGLDNEQPGDKSDVRLRLTQELNTVALKFMSEEYWELLSMFKRMEASSRGNGSIGPSVETTTKNPNSCISSGMNFTVDLWNASHCDVNDGSYSIGMWACDNPDDEDIADWEFVLPNVYLCNFDNTPNQPAANTERNTTTNQGIGAAKDNESTCQKGTTIRLFHGCVISWEGTVIRHCTSRHFDGNIKPTRHTYSAFWTTSKDQHKLSDTLATSSASESESDDDT